MSHVPEHVEQYVCTDCQVLHAGEVEIVDGDHHYNPPAECGACGATDFATIEQYPHLATQ